MPLDRCSTNRREIRHDPLWREYLRDPAPRALDALCRRYDWIVTLVGDKFTWLDRDLQDDLQQEGRIALMRAVERFDPERGVKFWTFAAWKVRGAMLDYLQALGRAARLDTCPWPEEDAFTVPPALTVPDHAPRICEEDCTRSRNASLHAAVALLPPREREVIEDTFYLGLTLKQTAARWQRTEQLAGHYRLRGIARLRGYLKKPMFVLDEKRVNAVEY